MSLVHTLGVTCKTEATIHEIYPYLYHLQTILLLVIHEKIWVIWQWYHRDSCLMQYVPTEIFYSATTNYSHRGEGETLREELIPY